MKSEHRHELKTNDLQHLTTEVGKKLEPYSNGILIGLIVVSVLAAGAIYAFRTWGGTSAAGWTELSAANTPEQFATIADKYDGKAIGDWARLEEAESLLESGIRQMFTHRAAADSDLKQAQESFQRVIDSSSAAPEARDRALFGLAHLLEVSCDGDTAPAIAAYEKLKGVTTSGYSAFYTREADERIAALKSGKNQEFYAWFHKQAPKPPDRPQPNDGAAATDTDEGPALIAPDTGAATESPSDAASPSNEPAATSPPANDGAPADNATPKTDASAAESQPAPSDTPAAPQ